MNKGDDEIAVWVEVWATFSMDWEESTPTMVPKSNAPLLAKYTFILIKMEVFVEVT